MKKSFFRKGASALLAVVMCLSSFLGIGATTAFAAEEVSDTVVMFSFPREGDANFSGNWGHGDLQYMNGWSAGASSKITVYTVGSWSGKACYCIEPGTPLAIGDTMTKRDETYWDNYPSAYNKTISADEIKMWIGRIFQYGYTGNVDIDWRSQNAADADKMAHVNISSVQSWWEDVGSEGDVEGLLVHFFLLRHGKIKKSIFGDVEQLSQRLSSELDNFPDWLIVLPRFSSLDDLFDTMLDDDFEENLSRYLEKMPRNRKSAEEILEEMTQWDEWELYRILLQEYMEFLSPEEVTKTVQAYRKKFIIPLSSIIDENDLKIADEASAED